ACSRNLATLIAPSTPHYGSRQQRVRLCALSSSERTAETGERDSRNQDTPHRISLYDSILTQHVRGAQPADQLHVYLIDRFQLEVMMVSALRCLLGLYDAGTCDGMVGAESEEDTALARVYPGEGGPARQVDAGLFRLL